VDFELVLKNLLSEFDKNQLRYAVIGGFALGILGHVRATMDLDFLIHRDDLDKLNNMLTGLGYQRVAQTENVSHYAHPDAAWGGVDFVHAFRKSSLAMLDRAKSYPVFSNRQSIRTVDAEDIIGLKVQAMTNDPDRKPQDMSDIETLMRIHGTRLNWSRIRDYYDLFGIGDEAQKLRDRFGHVK
jgi:putative nucleotidyltransferase-like protein